MVVNANQTFWKGDNIESFFLFFLFWVNDVLESCQFDCQFSSGDFIVVSQETSNKVDLDTEIIEKDPLCSVLLPNWGSIKVYEPHASLEKHISFGKCKILPERDPSVLHKH